MELDKINKVYLVGIGGIGMSALARYFHAVGAIVSGYDKTPSIVTDSLQKLGISISFVDDVDSISKEIVSNKDALIVYTPAIPSENKILRYFENNLFSILKRSEVLGIISKDTFCLAVAGTHGKTTISALLGHIMKENSTGASSFVGGIISGYNSNLILGTKKVSVMEADEYDRSFLKLFPNIACVTSMDADHLDIYGDVSELENTFEDFASLVPDNGKLISRLNLGLKKSITYSIDEKGDYNASNIRIEKGQFVFDISYPNNKVLKNVKSNLPGRYNIENTLAAFAMANQYGLCGREIVKSIESFQGIYRRFNVFEFEKIIIIDDYAHHPSELQSVLDATRELYENKEILLVFQPHLFSRTKDFEKEFIEVLSKFDSLRLLDIYPARELPIEGVSSKVLLDKIDHSNKKVISKKDIKTEIISSKMPIVMMLGAGDISVEIEKLKKYSV